jgi:hypothetical protein
LVQEKVTDSQKIKDWSANSHNAAHKADLSWLKTQVTELQKRSDGSFKTKSPERSIVIITHHAPSTQRTADPAY